MLVDLPIPRGIYNPDGITEQDLTEKQLFLKTVVDLPEDPSLMQRAGLNMQKFGYKTSEEVRTIDDLASVMDESIEIIDNILGRNEILDKLMIEP